MKGYSYFVLSDKDRFEKGDIIIFKKDPEKLEHVIVRVRPNEYDTMRVDGTGPYKCITGKKKIEAWCYKVGEYTSNRWRRQ